MELKYFKNKTYIRTNNSLKSDQYGIEILPPYNSLDLFSSLKSDQYEK